MSITETQFFTSQAQAFEESKTQTPNPNAIVTGLKLEGGSYHVLSRFGDSRWELPDSIFPSSATRFDRFINFDLCPEPFRLPMKQIVFRYYLEGRPGSDRPSGHTIRHKFTDSLFFLRFLEALRIHDLKHVNQLICQQYVDHTKSKKKKDGQKLSELTIHSRLSALEWLHLLSDATAQPMPAPWPESSSKALAGIVGSNRPANLPARTKVIPNDVLALLFQHSLNRIKAANELYELREQVLKWRREGRRDKYIGEHLEKSGWSLSKIRQEEHFLTYACITLILATSGIRVGELLSLKSGCAFTRRNNDQLTYWIRGESTKTKYGECTWLVTELTHQAIKTLEKLSHRTRKRYREYLADIRKKNPLSPELTAKERISENLLLLNIEADPSLINMPAVSHVTFRLKAYAEACETKWRLSAHQFRRTFAVYAARSSLGDLRYLREHFKHWSLDMTTLYAMDSKQDAELYDEVGYESISLKEAVITDQLLDQKCQITGGGAEPIKVFRSSNDNLTTYKNRMEMAKQLSPTIHLRATGVAWCTADLGGCNGGQATEMTRCGNGCSNAVITADHKGKWNGIYRQQLELRKLDDIGPAGQQRVERDIKISKQVLIELGASKEELDNVQT